MTFIPCYDLSENARLRADVYILSYISNAIALESHPFPNFFKKCNCSGSHGVNLLPGDMWLKRSAVEGRCPGRSG